jgi:hypothetical protein
MPAWACCAAMPGSTWALICVVCGGCSGLLAVKYCGVSAFRRHSCDERWQAVQGARAVVACAVRCRLCSLCCCTALACGMHSRGCSLCAACSRTLRGTCHCARRWAPQQPPPPWRQHPAMCAVGATLYFQPLPVCNKWCMFGSPHTGVLSAVGRLSAGGTRGRC